MNSEGSQEDSADLSLLLRAAEGGPELPSGFGAAVWRQIGRERGGAETETAGWVGWLAQLLLQPRWAAAVLLGMAVLGAITGAVSASSSAKREARDRYVALIDPLQTRP
jgi:hypothetical protein